MTIMPEAYTAAEVSAAIRTLEQQVTQQIQQATDAQFFAAPEAGWSAADYLRHLLLSIKPVSKGLGLPRARMQSMFGLPERPSHTYENLAAQYQSRLATGIRAEDYEKVMPTSYRVPEEVTDLKAYLTEQWVAANQQFLEVVATWSEAELDSHQLPHPALGQVTAREMLFFTLAHNRLHAGDIARLL
jgi:hypothetical protein